jgi:hypothetical protein
MIAMPFVEKAPHKKVTALLAENQLERIKGSITGKSPLLTKKLQKFPASVQFDNSKLLQAFPQFQYRTMQSSIKRISAELKNKYQFP